MSNIYLYNVATDEEIEIKHKNVHELKGGFYVVKDFKKIRASVKAIQDALAQGLHVYHLNAYCGNGEPAPELFFTGKVIWKNERNYEMSSGCAGGGINLGLVPAGTLVMGMSDD